MRDPNGFTVAEAVLAGFLLTLVVGAATRWIHHSAVVATQMQREAMVPTFNPLLTLFVNDLREASPESVSWPSLVPNGAVYDSVTFSKQRLDINNPSQPPTSTSFRYYYQAVSADTGDLMRQEGVKGPEILARSIQKPSAAQPLFRQDGQVTGVLIMSFTYVPAPPAETVLIQQRVAVGG